jgi:urease accessory protein
MEAVARVRAESDGHGKTRLAVLRGESPLLLRRTGSPGPGVTVHLVGGAAGPLRGDDLRLAIEVGPDAYLDIRTVAASLALPGRATDPPSRLIVRAAVAAGARLRWLPEPLIAAAGCHHRTVAEVEVADGGAVIWRDDLVCGRHDEPSGDVTITTTIRYAGGTLYRGDLSVGPNAPGWSGPAVLGDGRAAGSVVIAGTDALPPPAWTGGDGAAWMRLAGPGVLVTAVGPDIRAVRAVLDPVCATAAGGDSPDRWPHTASPMAQAATAIGTP